MKASMISIGNYSIGSTITNRLFSTSNIKNNPTLQEPLNTTKHYENHVPVLVKQCCELLKRSSELEPINSEITTQHRKHIATRGNKKSAKKINHDKSEHEQLLFIDATFGAGGYTREILKMYPNSKVIGIDTDYYSNPVIQQHEKLIHDTFGKERLEVHGVNFRNLKQLVEEKIIPNLDAKQKIIGTHVIDGIVFDLGVSSMQLDYGHRGFSFLRDGPLGQYFVEHSSHYYTSTIHRYENECNG